MTALSSHALDFFCNLIREYTYFLAFKTEPTLSVIKVEDRTLVTCSFSLVSVHTEAQVECTDDLLVAQARFLRAILPERCDQSYTGAKHFCNKLRSRKISKAPRIATFSVFFFSSGVFAYHHATKTSDITKQYHVHERPCFLALSPMHVSD